MTHQFIIVSRDDLGLYQTLRADWARTRDVAVILDRRRGQRRQAAVTTAIERRREERRQVPPVETVFAWRGGGASARRSDIRAALGGGPASIAVRQRPAGKARGRTVLPQQTGLQAEEAARSRPTMDTVTSAGVALVVLLGSLSSGLFGGLILWALLTYELRGAIPRGARPGTPSLRAQLPAWCRRPLQRLTSLPPAVDPTSRKQPSLKSPS